MSVDFYFSKGLTLKQLKDQGLKVEMVDKSIVIDDKLCVGDFNVEFTDENGDACSKGVWDFDNIEDIWNTEINSFYGRADSLPTVAKICILNKCLFLDEYHYDLCFDRAVCQGDRITVDIGLTDYIDSAYDNNLKDLVENALTFKK